MIKMLGVIMLVSISFKRVIYPELNHLSDIFSSLFSVILCLIHKYVKVTLETYFYQRKYP